MGPAVAPPSAQPSQCYVTSRGAGRRVRTGLQTKTESTAVTLNREILRAQDWMKIQDIVKTKGPQFREMNVATAIWRLADLETRRAGDSAAVRPLLLDLCAMVSTHVQNFDARSMSNCLWALSSLGYVSSPHLLRALSDVVIAKKARYTPQEASRILHGMARLASRDMDLPAHLHQSNFFDAMSHLLEPHIRTMTLPNLVNTLSAFATVGHHPGGVYLDHIAGVVKHGLLEHCLPQHVASLLSSFAQFNYYPLPCMDLALDWVVAHIEHFDNHELGEIMKVLAILEPWRNSSRAARACASLLPALVIHLAPHTRDLPSHVLESFYLLASTYGSSPSGFGGGPRGVLWGRAAQDLFARGRKAWVGRQRDVQRGQKQDDFHQSVHTCLNSLGLPCTLSPLVHGEVVASFTFPALPHTALILLGEHDLTRNEPHLPMGDSLGAALLRRRLLEVHGWRVIELRHSYWWELPEWERKEAISALLGLRRGTQSAVVGPLADMDSHGV